MKNSTPTIPYIVSAYMEKYGCNHAELITTNNDGDVYSLSLLDKGGNALPIGFPIFVIIKDNDAKILKDLQALKYLSTLPLDD